MAQHPLERDTARRLEQDDLVPVQRRLERRTQRLGVGGDEQPVPEPRRDRARTPATNSPTAATNAGSRRTISAAAAACNLALSGPAPTSCRPRPPAGVRRSRASQAADSTARAQRSRVRVVGVVDDGELPLVGRRPAPAREPRPRRGRRSAAAGSTPASRATASAIIALSTWCSPNTGSVTSRPRQRSTQRPASSSSTASGCTSAGGAAPATMRPGAAPRFLRQLGRLVPTTATGTPSTSASFSRITPSSEPKPSTCA